MKTQVLPIGVPDTATREGTMQAIVQEGYGSADVLQLRELPRPALADDRVLVRVRAASVNALDWHGVHGGRVLQIVAAVMRQPDHAVVGVDLAGTVEAVGRDVTAFTPGDEVFGGGPGSFAEYTACGQRGLALKPQALSFEQAATLGVAGRTALQGLRDHAGVRPGQHVLVNGAGGGVGTFAVQIAKALGAHVTAVTSTRNVDFIRSLGAEEIVDFGKEDFTTRGRRYDVVFDVAANRSIGACRRVLVPNGVVVLVGAAKGGGMLTILAHLLMGILRARVLRQRVVAFVAKTSPDDLVALGELVEAGKIAPAIERTYPLSEAREALRYMGAGHARGKLVIAVS